MSIPLFEINEVLYRWASNEPPVDDFTVENVLNAVGLNNSSYDEVFHYLMSKRLFELIPKKMILCPHNHKGETFLLEEEIDDILFDCHLCSEEDFEPSNLLLVFSFTDTFKEAAQKKKSNVARQPQRRTLVMA
ncbi:hypothetical protein [Cytobacillus firmus]|uniref:hypothetical protein n=1 Tax=Cytobacillus firmus TaxID=1399 RepID=UPI0018CD7CCF|nr:hypothetical protein [Cytobacillus firmus]MBG9550019.1 hypothetical protein [Cytobacillus firmus]MBG9604011.1 hypothetical protein [Cytobacillus firmus]MED1940804.1 hypothetical protein [Cytobacillus firmus]